MEKTSELLIKGSTELNKMWDALQRTSIRLRRDFGEVENLQQSIRGARDFVNRAQKWAEESILSDLMLVRPLAGLLTPNMQRDGNGRDEFVLAFSGAENFVRGNPHFAISLALRSNDETKIALVYAPIEDRLYYAESDNGAFVFTAYHSNRIKTSNVKQESEMMVAGRDRITGCVALDLAFIASGKFDKMECALPDYAEICAGELLVREAGGRVEMTGDLIAYNS